MGWELELNAIPAQCTLLESVLNGDIDAEYLTFVRSYFRLRRQQQSRINKFPYGEAEYKRFVDALEELVETHPGIEHRYCDLDRRFDCIKWLLMKCALDQEEELLAVTAITGHSNVLPSARSIQGFPIRWTPPDKCKLIHIWLSDIAVEDIKSKYETILMQDAQLYKWQQAIDTNEAWEWIVSDFMALNQFYQDVVDNSEAVLVVTD
ncbi:hypothetical protein NSMS1_47600 [Nostoc sp. MS1]|nr:hypothetical protein NSMS1_47600 [Nostoc sp. MS1]